MLRARAARNLLQFLKFVCRYAKGKPVIHPSRRENDTLKLQVADVAGRVCLND